MAVWLELPACIVTNNVAYQSMPLSMVFGTSLQIQIVYLYVIHFILLILDGMSNHFMVLKSSFILGNSLFSSAGHSVGKRNEIQESSIFYNKQRWIPLYS